MLDIVGVAGDAGDVAFISKSSVPGSKNPISLSAAKSKWSKRAK